MVRLRAVQRLPSPPHRDGRGGHADRAVSRPGVPRAATRRSRPPLRRDRTRERDAARHAPPARSGQGPHPRLPDLLDAQVDVGAAPGLDDAGLGRRLPSRRGLLPGGVPHAHVDVAQPADHRVARRRAPADGARRLRADDARGRDRLPHPARGERAPADLQVLPHRHAGTRWCPTRSGPRESRTTAGRTRRGKSCSTRGTTTSSRSIRRG